MTPPETWITSTRRSHNCLRCEQKRLFSCSFEENPTGMISSSWVLKSNSRTPSCYSRNQKGIRLSKSALRISPTVWLYNGLVARVSGTGRVCFLQRAWSTSRKLSTKMDSSRSSLRSGTRPAVASRPSPLLRSRGVWLDNGLPWVDLGGRAAARRRSPARAGRVDPHRPMEPRDNCGVWWEPASQGGTPGSRVAKPETEEPRVPSDCQRTGNYLSFR
jgi:hypothetical protein